MAFVSAIMANHKVLSVHADASYAFRKRATSKLSMVDE
jgi:hypothetical protein